MEERKNKEKIYHNLKRDALSGTAEHADYNITQRKWYAITRKSKNCYEKWRKENCPGQRVLDYGCGNGISSLKITRTGAKEVIGIDISDVSIENAKREGLLQFSAYH